MNNGVQFNPDAQCRRCGCFGAYEFDGEVLCSDCYELRGSCCQEFGGDDAWKKCEVVRTPASQAEPERRIDQR